MHELAADSRAWQSRPKIGRGAGPAAGPSVVSANKQRFAPLPARAARDPRLSARHWRLLHIIGLHDKLDKNGAGCFVAQRRLAEHLNVDEADLSNLLTDLRMFGYIDSTIHPTDRRRRVHRIIYNDDDRNWDRITWRGGQVHPWSPHQVSSGDTWKNGERCLDKSGEILGKNGEKSDVSGNDLNKLDVGTYVNIKEHIKKTDLIEGTDCAEARSQSKVTEAEKHLTDLEALAASPNHDDLKFERPLIERLARDACLPETLNERAARLLHQIGQL